MARPRKIGRAPVTPSQVWTGDEPLSTGRSPGQICREFADEWIPVSEIENRKTDVARHCDTHRVRCHQTKSAVKAKFRRPEPIGNSSTGEADE